MKTYTINVNIIFDGQDAADATVTSPICEEERFRLNDNNHASRLYNKLKDIEDRVMEEFQQNGINYPRHLVNFSCIANCYIPGSTATNSTGNNCSPTYTSSMFVKPPFGECTLTIVNYTFSAPIK